MTRFLVIGFVLASAANASAQSVDSTATFSPDNSAVSPTSVVEGPGVKVGEGTVLHPIFGVETGYVSNTFYQDADEKPAGILRLIAQIGTSSLSPQRLAGTAAEGEETEGEPQNVGGFQYRLDLRASYDLMLSGNDAVSDTGGLGLGASAFGLVNPQGSFQFQINDDFHRLIRAANFETDANTNRILNTLRLALNYKPVDHTIGGSLYYENYLDIFERDEQSFANRMRHRFGLRPYWQWRPRTQFYVDGSIGIMSGLGSDADMKVSSMPLTVKGGIATLLSPTLSLNLEAGYQNGFYEAGPSYSSPMVNVQIAYRYSPFGRFGVNYSYLHEDSVNASFYREHVLKAWVRHIVRPITFQIQPELHFREYDGIMLVTGPPTRDDTIFAVMAGASYNFRDWLAATLSYRFAAVETDYRYTQGGLTDDPSYARHEVLAGMRFAL
jgi:opacity protein-like surface antigen